MRHVYTNDEIPHLWANQTQPEARNSGNTLFFNGATIYSYRTSFPIARLYKNKKGETLALFNSARYGNTTAGHQSDCRRAAQQFTCIEVPYLVPYREPQYGHGDMGANEHAQNLKYLAEEYAKLLGKAKRSLQSSNVQYTESHALTLAQQSAQYIAFFKVKAKPISVNPAEWTAARERVQRIENPDPASADKRQRDAAKRKARKELQESLAVDCWRTNWRLAGAFGSIPLKQLRRYHWRDSGGVGDVMLRLDGDEIVTSMGAHIPKDHAPIIWKQVQRCVSSQTPWEKNGHTIHAGAYSIDRIEPDGTMKAGCHTIPHSELRSMARALGLAS